MPVRGPKPIMPKSGGKPSGVFASKNSAGSAPEKGLMEYAHKAHGHQKPVKRNNMLKSGN